MEGWQHLNALRHADEVEHALRRRIRERRRNIRAVTEPFNDMMVNDFIKLYRLPQNMVRYLIEELRPAMTPTVRRSAVSIETKILSTLRFYATGSYQRAVCQDMYLAMSQSMVSRCIHEVTAAINNVLAHQWIKFPMTPAERNATKQRFYAATGLPGTIGAIDCTHVAIVRPAEHDQQYVNRKSFHSLNVQASMRVSPGATGDAFVWRSSACKAELDRRYTTGERGEWLIGDSGYPSEPWLLTPILNAAPGSPEENYTRIHCATRNCIERCFELLKARWRCLLSHRSLHYDPHTARQIVNACAVLHNMAVKARLPDPEPLQDEEAGEEWDSDAGDIQPNAVDVNQDILGCAHAIRAQVVNRLWQRNKNKAL